MSYHSVQHKIAISFGIVHSLTILDIQTLRQRIAILELIKLLSLPASLAMGTKNYKRETFPAQQTHKRLSNARIDVRLSQSLKLELCCDHIIFDQ